MDTRGPSRLPPSRPASFPPGAAPPSRQARSAPPPPEPARPYLPPAGTGTGIVRIGTTVASAIAAYVRVSALQTVRRIIAGRKPIEHIDAYV